MGRRALKAFTKTFQKGNQIGNIKDKVDGSANRRSSAGQVMERGRVVRREDSKTQNHLSQQMANSLEILVSGMRYVIYLDRSRPTGSLKP